MVTKLFLLQDNVLCEVVVTKLSNFRHQLSKVGMATGVGRERHLLAEMSVHDLDVVGHEHAVVVVESWYMKSSTN